MVRKSVERQSRIFLLGGPITIWRESCPRFTAALEIICRRGKCTMRWFQGFALAAVLGISALAAGQDAAPKATPELEKVLWDVNQQWLCSGPYQKPYKACVEFRSKYWVDQFFEIGRTGLVEDKTQMVAQQSAVDKPLGMGPHQDV